MTEQPDDVTAQPHDEQAASYPEERTATAAPARDIRDDTVDDPQSLGASTYYTGGQNPHDADDAPVDVVREQ